MLEFLFIYNFLLMFFLFLVRRNWFVLFDCDVKIFIYLNVIFNCVFVNNNDMKILEENNYIVRFVE